MKRLEIQGFKSFANKTTLAFERGTTSIVGPNGSGKSNIADAIRWVLGEQSQKLLRGKKSEDVIFAGSEKKSRMGFAEVAVTFDNEDRKIPLDYAEISITRRIDRSGESEYLINGNKVRLLDVVDLILKSNINTARYTVIGQGAIDNMILSGPAEIKSLIDEASGVKTYYIRREKTLKRLEVTTNNLVRVKDLLSEIEPRLKSLRRQAKKMEERELLENELKIYQKELYLSRYSKVKELLDAFIFKISEVSGEIKALESEMHKHRANLEKTETQNRTEVNEYKSIQQEIKRLADLKNKLVEDAAIIRGRLHSQAGPIGDKKHLNIEKGTLESAKAALVSQISKIKEVQQAIGLKLENQGAAFSEVDLKLRDMQRAFGAPKSLDFQEFSKGMEDLDKSFGEFYVQLQGSGDPVKLLSMAESFKKDLALFKEKTYELSKNPFSSFEAQRINFEKLLVQKESMLKELNRLDLENSKAGINLEYLSKELSKTEQKLLQINLELKGSEGADDYTKELLSKENELNKEIFKLGGEIEMLEQKIGQYYESEQKLREYMLEGERQYRLRQDDLSKLKDRQSALEIEKAKYETQEQSILQEAGQELDSAAVDEIRNSKSAKSGGNAPGLEDKIHKLKRQLETIGGIDELTLKEYRETETRFSYLSSQVADLEKAAKDLRQVIEELDLYIKKKFQSSFSIIDQKFQAYFRILFNGGRAYLSILHANKEVSTSAGIEDDEIKDGQQGEEDESSAKKSADQKALEKYEKKPDDITGIDIKATPPGKKLSSISALSGGERALTSIALLCALLTSFPSPFVVLDEVDAALDEANTIRFAEILDAIAKQTQFIAVTHNRETMKKANALYGITMGDDSISKVFSLKLEQAQVYAQ